MDSGQRSGNRGQLRVCPDRETFQFKCPLGRGLMVAEPGRNGIESHLNQKSASTGVNGQLILDTSDKTSFTVLSKSIFEGCKSKSYAVVTFDTFFWPTRPGNSLLLPGSSVIRSQTAPSVNTHYVRTQCDLGIEQSKFATELMAGEWDCEFLPC